MIKIELGDNNVFSVNSNPKFKNQQYNNIAGRLVTQLQFMINRFHREVIESPCGPTFLRYVYNSDFDKMIKLDKQVIELALKNSYGLVRNILQMLDRGEFDTSVTEDEMKEAIEKLKDPKNWYPEVPTKGTIDKVIREMNSWL